VSLLGYQLCISNFDYAPNFTVRPRAIWCMVISYQHTVLMRVTWRLPYQTPAQPFIIITIIIIAFFYPLLVWKLQFFTSYMFNLLTLNIFHPLVSQFCRNINFTWRKFFLPRDSKATNSFTSLYLKQLYEQIVYYITVYWVWGYVVWWF